MSLGVQRAQHAVEHPFLCAYRFDMQTTNLLTPGEAADLLRLPTRKVQQLAKRGEIPTIRLPGDEFRFDAGELWKWIDSRKESCEESAQ